MISCFVKRKEWILSTGNRDFRINYDPQKLDAETTQEKPQKIEASMSPIKGTKCKKQVKVYQKIISENVLPGRTLDQIRNKVGKLRETYLQKKKKANFTVENSTSDSPPISDGENSDNKENYKAYETRKKKRKSTGIEGISGMIAAMGESRDRFYEKN
ncbi:hypothetical protein RhiirB3_424618 [Rhizophagus irregularis]|nr:hypothetical protein RhiirB3_424618 [Rhizophagus irregularis]